MILTGKDRDKLDRLAEDMENRRATLESTIDTLSTEQAEMEAAMDELRYFIHELKDRGDKIEKGAA